MAVAQIRSGSEVGSTTSPAPRRQSVGQDEFLKMMLAQLKNQDPLKPLEPAQFLGQLAQFSTVTGIQAMQQSLASLNATLGSAGLMEGASLLGRDVLSAATTGRLGAAGGLSGAVVAPPGASAVQVAVRDLSGALVRRFEVPAGNGLVDFQWDGVDQAGRRAAPGLYAIEAVGVVGSKGESLEVLLEQRVNSVSIDGTTGALLLNTSGGPVPLDRVRRVM
jgi:flagellar basal-body rod modification protein FlgD